MIPFSIPESQRVAVLKLKMGSDHFRPGLCSPKHAEEGYKQSILKCSDSLCLLIRKTRQVGLEEKKL